MKFVGVIKFLFLGWLGYLTVLQLQGNNLFFIHNIDLVFHEAGHTIFYIFGKFISILGGSLLQLIIPAILAYYFYTRNEKFSLYVVLWWLGENFRDVAIYAGDASTQKLPLIADGLIHDWNYILKTLHLLQFDWVFEGVFLTIAFALMGGSLIFAGYNTIKKHFVV